MDIANSITLIKVKCAHCGKFCKKTIGHVNRAKKVGLKLFCNQKCFGLSRRLNLSVKEKKKLKSEYDRIYRAKNEERLKKVRAEYFKRDYAAKPEKYKAIRKQRYAKHLRYLSTPEYKAWKKEYDAKYRSKINFGQFGEAFLILQQLESLLDNAKLRIEKNTHNKKQKRSKLCQSKKQLQKN